jgi:predicted nucleic acid-binding protein
VILCDAGPLVALILRNDAHHARCRTALDALADEQLLTTWPCFTEAMYFLGKKGGVNAQKVLWSFCDDEALLFHSPTENGWHRIRELMDDYDDRPMDLADASLVAAAERLGLNRIFTLDSHFYAYRIHGTGTFDVIPG